MVMFCRAIMYSITETLFSPPLCKNSLYEEESMKAESDTLVDHKARDQLPFRAVFRHHETEL